MSLSDPLLREGSQRVLGWGDEQRAAAEVTHPARGSGSQSVAHLDQSPGDAGFKCWPPAESGAHPGNC